MVDERGQVLPLLALGMLTFLLGVAALVVDLGHAYVVKRQLQAAADSAALAAAGDLPDTATALATAQTYGVAGKNPVAGADQTATPVCLRTVPYCYGNLPGTTIGSGGRANGIMVEAHAAVPTTFARLFGLNTINITTRATACGLCGARPLDIALVLDRTGSMSDDLGNLKSGAATFLQSLNPQIDHVALVLLPPAPGGDCRWPPLVDPYGNDNYVVAHLSGDYLNADKTLNQSSALVQQLNCFAAGGSTSYKRALKAAYNELMTNGRTGVAKAIVFESDGAANVVPDDEYQPSDPSNWLTPSGVPNPGLLDDFNRPCGSAVDYARSIRSDTYTTDPTKVTIFTVAYATNQDDNCYVAPQEKITSYTNGRPNFQTVVGYRSVRETGYTASSALAAMASKDGAFTQQNQGDMSDVFAAVANGLLGAKLVADDS